MVQGTIKDPELNWSDGTEEAMASAWNAEIHKVFRI
jgi:hypothetical protein